MLSFREVHLIDTSAASIPQTTAVYVPPLLLPWQDDDADGQSGGASAAPSATSESLFYLATCDSSIVAGNAVVAGSGNSVNLADNGSPQPVVGMVTRKRAATLAVVQTAGEVVLGVNNLSPGVDYFLGQNGALVTTPLYGVPFVQKIGTATTATSIYLALDGHVVRQSSD